MFDIANGKIRVRRWPRGRGKPKTQADRERLDKFRAVQNLTKYVDSALYKNVIDQTQGSPLLPRDILTMIFYNTAFWFILPDGRKLFPMTFYTEVSNSLDSLSQQVGDTLIRGPEGWIGAPYDPSPGTGEWTVLADVVIASPLAFVECINLPEKAELLIKCEAVTMSASSFRAVQVSTDNGASYYTGSTDYKLIDPNGVLADRNSIKLHNTQNAGARSGSINLLDYRAEAGAPLSHAIALPELIKFAASTDPINAIRIGSPSGANMTGGRVSVLVR